MAAKPIQIQVDVDGDLFRECVDAIERVGQKAGYGLMESVATVDEILAEVNAKPQQYHTSGVPKQEAFYRRIDVLEVLNKALTARFISISK